VLGVQDAPGARNWLVNRALTRPRWFRRRRLMAKTTELVAVLGALAGRWRNDPQVAVVLRLAAASADPEIRAAVGPTAS
jgi:hypothetical protein